MTGRGSRMSPKERYLRSVYLNYQVCTDVVRHYFDGLHPPTSLVQYLLDQRTKFEKEKKKIPNYQWIQLYPEVLFRADVHIKETYLASYEKTDQKDYKEFTDRISTIFTCLFDTVDGDQKVKVVNLSRLESGEVLAKLEITSQYNPDDRKIRSALEVPVTSGNVDASLETSTDGFTFSQQGVLFRADVHIKETYLASYEKTDLKDYKEFTDRISTIFTCLFDTVDGDQKVKVVNLSRLESGEVLASLEITSQYNPDDKIIQSALEVPVTSGNVDASLETSTDGFTFSQQGDTYSMEIKLTKVNAAALAQKDTKEFRIMAKRLERILLLLFDTVPGTQSVEVEEFRYLTLDCATAICKLTSEKHKDDKRLEEAISIPTSEGRLGKTLKTICTHNGFSFKEVIVFEAEINVIEKYSKTLANSNSNEFKAFANRVQPILKGLYDSVTGEQDVEIVKCRQGPSDTVLVLFHLVSCGNNDEEGLRAVTENKMRTESLSLSYGITDDGFSFETNKCIFEATLKLAEKYSDSKGLANPKSEAFKSLKEKVQPEILSLYDSVCGSQEIDILRYKSSGAAHSIIFNLTSRGCSDESILKEPIETQIQTGLLGSSLKVSTSGLTLQKLTERVFYQVTLNVKRQFTDELKRKHSTEFNAFSKFVQSVLSTHYENVPGNQEVNVVKCQQGPSGTVSTDVIIEIISHGCTDEVMVRQPIKDLIAFGKLELTLKTSPTDFSFKIVRGSKPVSSECFDLSLLITLLRRDSNVKPPKNGFDVLPSKDDISDGAQIATIKHYRNELAHARDAKMNENKFDSLWIDLKNAVRILGKDDKFMKAVDDASTMKLDSSTEKALIRMVQHDEFDEKFRVQDERNVQQDEMNRKMESGIQENRRDIQRLDPQNKRKRNLIDQTESRIRKFMEDTKETFVETETQKKVLKILERDNCLVMISKGGRGKTALGLQIASIFKDKEFTPMYVVNNEIETMRDIIDFESKNFIIVDDLFGQTNSHINDHTLEVFYSSVKRANCQSKVILNIRESPGCNKSILESHPILKESQVINLDDNTYDLSQSEKKEILLKHMKKFNLSLCHCDIFDLVCKESIYTDTDNQSLVVCRSTVKDIVQCKTLEGFPEACHMFCSDNTLTVLGLLYFKNTREKLVTTMKNLCAEGYDEIQKKYHYSTLVYVALKGNIDLNYLNECLLLKILSYYEQKDEKIREPLISKAVQDLSLNGKYLVKDREGETYRFQHATILEAVLISYGKECPEDLLVACSASFFQEYIRPESYRKKKPKHVYLFVSDDVLSNNLLSWLVKKHKFKSVRMLKVSLEQRDNKMFPNSNYYEEMYKYETDLEEDQRYIEYDEYGTYHGFDPYQIDCNLNPMYHKIIGRYLFDMGVVNELDSFVRLFLLKLSRDFLESEKIDPDLMKFFFDGFTCRGTRQEAVSKYLDFFTKYLCKYGSFAVIQAFCKPLGRIADTDYWIMVPVDDTVLAKKYIEIFFNSYYADEYRYEYDDPRVEYQEKTREGNLSLILCCLNQPCRENNLETVGIFLHMNFKRDLEFVNFILDKLIGKSKCNYIDAFEMKPLLDGLTDYGKNLEIISTNYDFCDECLFKYGSIPVVLSLCRPFSYKGSDQDIVRVDNQLLANKLMENLKYTPEDWDFFFLLLFDYKPVQVESYWYRPCRSNTKYFFFNDKAFYNMTFIDDLASYIYNYGVLENDEEFIQTVITAIHSFENIEKEDCYTILDKKINGPRDPLKLCKGRLKNLTDCFRTLEIREMKRKFPCLIDSLLILYDSDDLLSDSDKNSDTSNTDHEDDDINEPETGLDVDGHDAYNYEEIGINEADYNEDAEGGEDDGIHE